jgi:hypothetical protein
MSGAHDNAVQCMKALLAELPAEFTWHDPSDPDCPFRSEFRVIKRSNVRKVHQALWDLQVYLGMQEEE